MKSTETETEQLFSMSIQTHSSLLSEISSEKRISFNSLNGDIMLNAQSLMKSAQLTPIGSFTKLVTLIFLTLAAIIRRVYVSKSRNVGIGTLKRLLGKKHRRGVNPPKFARTAGKIVREIVSQLKKAGYVENFCTSETQTLGLTLTKQGRAELDKVATRLAKRQ